MGAWERGRGQSGENTRGARGREAPEARRGEGRAKSRAREAAVSVPGALVA